MDIYCPRCAEPTDIEELHEAVEIGTAENFDDARRQFYSVGCRVLFGGSPCPKTNDPRALLAAELADILGEDVDGIAAMHEDAEAMGWGIV